MNVTINRLDPNVPDPVESRRRAAGRFVRIAYTTIVFGVLAFFIIYFGAPFVFLRGPGIVTSPRYVVSLPFTVQVNQMKLVPGASVKAGEEIAEVLSPEQDSIVATYMRALADISGRTAELRIKARVAQESLEASRSYLRVTEEAAERIDAMATATVTFRMEVLRERASARKAVVSQEAEVAESAVQLTSLDDFIQQLRNRLGERGGPLPRRPGLCANCRHSLDRSRACRPVAGGGHSDRRNPRSDRCLRGLVHSQ
jgi:HlyD family secretion protein